ncbi:SAM-dependent methyltransferase [Desulfosarcina ovata subsp. sediminis]|uniref:SAM-dependent methyltransferase n=1 Tax=Desulfosarcina ovata subsp. sediminis TaxID=885957 RepID=A0A5K7ZXA3_9BACT|nr:methyltransferase domain-containing protein [Desulfosarcina ovata]BBO84879.1 SAM-dependent methyltransferase [Desulfosarcina ovata subsp. sediminis]
MNVSRPYESEAVRAVTGPAIRPGGLDLTRRAAGYCRLGPGGRVLDVGCGTGASLDLLARRFGARTIGIDLSPMLLGVARQNDPPLSVMRGNALALPLKSGMLRAVFFECVLSLVPDPAAALAEAHRVLQAAGRLVVADIYRQSEGGGPDPGPWAGVGGCLRGAVGPRTLLQRIHHAGFDSLLWEDHSDRLKALAAQLAWAGLSLKPWWRDTFPDGAACRMRPGYFLLVARKRS